VAVIVFSVGGADMREQDIIVTKNIYDRHQKAVSSVPQYELIYPISRHYIVR